MINITKNNREKYHKEIMKKLSDYSYRSKRYHIDFSITIGFSDKNVDFDELINKNRKTDTLIPLEENLCCVVLDCAPTESAIKATSNMQKGFKKLHSDKKLFTGVVTSKDYDNDKLMVNSLFDVLEYSVANNMNGLIADVHNMRHSS